MLQFNGQYIYINNGSDDDVQCERADCDKPIKTIQHMYVLW